MSFFAVLFALMLEQIKPLPRDNWVHDALASWTRWAGRNFDAGRPHHARIVWVVTVLVPAGAAALIHVLISRYSFFLALAFDVLAIYLTLGFRQFSHYFTDIRDAFEAAIDVPSLLVAPGIAPRINEAQPAWRRIIALTVSAGIPAPGLSSALTYVDTIRQPKGSTSMIQGMRDFFGAHTYERVDMPGHFHTLWSEDRSEVNA